MRVSVEIDADEVLEDLSDRDIADECRRRKLTVGDADASRLGPAIDDIWQIERALDRKDWPEVEHILRKAIRAAKEPK